MKQLANYQPIFPILVSRIYHFILSLSQKELREETCRSTHLRHYSLSVLHLSLTFAVLCSTFDKGVVY